MLQIIGIIIVTALIGSMKSTGDTLSKGDIVKLIAAILILMATGLFWGFVIIGLISFGIYSIVKKRYK